MTSRHEEYELGNEVTHLATSKAKQETSVISVRVTINDIGRLEGIGRESGKTVSQVIRDAIAAYQVKQPTMVVSLWSGSTIILGTQEEASGTPHIWDVNYGAMDLVSTGTAVPIEA